MAQKSILLIDPVHLTAQGLIRSIDVHPNLYLAAHQTTLISYNNKIAEDFVVIHLTEEIEQDILFLSKDKQSQRTLIIVPQDKPQFITQVWQLGFVVIVSEQSNQAEFDEALTSLHQGKRYYCQHTLSVIAQAPKDAEESIISEREVQVLRHIAKGQTTSQIAEKLHVSIHTVNSHRKNMMKKLNFNSPVELVVHAVKNNLLD